MQESGLQPCIVPSLQVLKSSCNKRESCCTDEVANAAIPGRGHMRERIQAQLRLLNPPPGVAGQVRRQARQERCQRAPMHAIHRSRPHQRQGCCRSILWRQRPEGPTGSSQISSLCSSISLHVMIRALL